MIRACEKKVTLAHHVEIASRCLIAGLLLTLAGACTVQEASIARTADKNRNESRSFSAKLIRVTDGDSLIVRDRSGKKHKLRLAGIDAPEGKQTGGPAARQALRDLLGKDRLRVTTGKTDRYKRMIAHVRVGSQDVSRSMLSAGMAWFYRRYERELPLARRQSYDLAEKSAKAQNRGLWADDAAIPPWEFRRRKR